MFGNILIVLIILNYGFLANLSLKPMPSGDYRVGYSFAWLIYVASFIISTGLLAWNMNLNHCFDWMSASFLHYRHWLVFLGWICFVVACIWSLEYHAKGVENNLPSFLNWFTWSRIYIWMPLMIFIACLYFLNAERLTGFPPFWAKTLIQTGLSVSFLIALGILGAVGKFWVQRSIQNFQRGKILQTERDSSYKAAFEYIQNYNGATVSDLLKFTHTDNDTELRNAAISKIKSFEHWENDLIGILEQKGLDKIYVYEDNTRYVYAFLDDNKADHPEKFIQPILSSLKVLAIRIRKSLNDPYNLELGLTDIEAMCQVLDTQFKSNASELRPGVLLLQKALETTAPDRKNKTHLKAYNKQLKRYRSAVNNWLESNQ